MPNKFKTTDHPPLSFVMIKGFGANPIPVQVSIDGRFLIISTYYMLSPVVAVAELIDSFIGDQAFFAKKNKNVFMQLLEHISLKSKEDESRVKDNDPLLFARAFNYILMTHDISNQDLELADSQIHDAIEKAIEQDDLIKNMHYNMVNAINSVS